MASLTNEDKAKVVTLFEKISKSMTAVSEIAQSLLSQKEDGLLPTEKGHGLLELKNQMMLSYLVNLVHLISDKISGNSIESSPDVERLVEIRTVLEKLQPVEKKLQNDFDRKIKASVTGVVDKNDPMAFKPDPMSLLSESEDEGSEKSSDESKEESDVYKPSKSVPTYFDESAQKKRLRLEDRTKKRLLNSELVNELARQYTDAPEAIVESSRPNTNRQAEKRERERTEYEETYLTRLPPEKKGKKRKAYGKKKGTKRRRTH